MNTQLTQEDRNRIFLSYYKSECVFDNGNTKHIGNLLGYDHRFGWMLTNRNPIVPYKFCNPEFTKLHLYDLSDISDEDAIEVAKIAARPHNRHFDESAIEYKVMSRNKPEQIAGIDIGIWANKKPAFAVRIEQDGVFSGTHPDEIFQHRAVAYYTPNQFEICDYLRSKSYHLPYKGVNLFDAGLAIRKTKTITQ